MPNVVKSYGVHLVDDVVKIKDVTLRRPPRKPKARPRVEAPEGAPAPEGSDIPAEGGEEGFEAFEPTDAGEGVQEAYQEEEFEPDELMEDGYEDGYAVGAVREEIIQSAMAEAGKILENAIREAEAKRGEILSGIEFEAGQIREQAAEQGKLEGFQSAVGEIKDVAAQIEQMLAVFEGERAGFEYEYEEQLKWLAFEIASKVLAKKVSENDAEMLEMVDKAVQGVRNEPWVRVEVSSEMTHLIDRLIALYETSANISVQSAKTSPGTVMVETPSGVVDASLKTQLENLREYFTKASEAAAQ